MSKTLIIAEKPELGRAIAEAILHSKNEQQGVIENDQYIVTWAFGHLLSLVEPEYYDEKYKDRFNQSTLPIYFENWKRIPSPDLKDYQGKVLQDNSYKRNRLSLIGKYLKECSTVIHCGDPDEEGQLLIDEILDYYNYQGKVYRVLINDNLPENIQKEFRNMKDNSSFRKLGDSAYARQMADKSFGINQSRWATINLKKYVYIGRVMTPTLALVVERDLAIENHKKQTYFESTFQMKIDSQKVDFLFEPKDTFYSDEKILDKGILDKLNKKYLNHLFESIRFDTNEKLKNPPLPYNATLLQAEMNSKYGYSLKKTLDITQTLRDKYKAITYNRSDCQYLRMEHFDMAKDLLLTIFENLQTSYPVDYKIKSKCFNDSKVSAHHGIIPQNHKVDLNAMTQDERNVYKAIAERYIMQFLPSLRRNECHSQIEIDEGTLKYTSSYITDEGYTKYFKSKQENNNETLKPFFNYGVYQGIVKDCIINEKETKPLRKYTQSLLIKDMCGISKYVKDPVIKKALKDKDQGKEGENGSIGTVATRAAIIDGLLTKGYLEEQNKNIVSTNLGRTFINMLPKNLITPDNTALWWMKQEQIKIGELDVNAVQKSVVDEFMANKDTMYIGKAELKEQRQSYGNCPNCGKPIYRYKTKKNEIIYCCSNSKENCGLCIPEKMKRFNDVIIISESKLKKLLSGKEIKSELTSKAGKKYMAKLKLEIKPYNGKMYPNLIQTGFVQTNKNK